MKNLNVIKYEIKEINSIANFLNSENNELDQETINDTRESIKYLLEEKSEQLELILKEQEIKEEKCKEIADFYTTTGTFTIRNNTPSLIIEDENLIPQRFITHISSTKIEKNEIKKEMKKGVEIPGVHLETSQSLLVR